MATWTRHRSSATAAAVLLALSPGALPAQPPDESLPAASNVPGADSPRIHRDGRVTFTLRTLEASSLQIAGGDGLGKGPFTLTKGPDGTWSVTIPPPVPGFHTYWFILDGVAVNDPGSETYFGYGRETSGIEIPEVGGDFYATKNVPHGEVREKWYLCGATGKWRRALVYTPPDYEKDSSRRYPVLILGAGSEERQLRANVSDTVDALRRSGIRVVFFESPGTAHEWQTWRRSLYDLAPRLFR